MNTQPCPSGPIPQPLTIPNAQVQAIKAAAEARRYEIVDGRTGKVVATAKTLRGAIRACDRRDNEYGAVRFRHRRVVAQ